MSNADYPWFPFLVRDWLADTKVARMPRIVVGCYIDLLCAQWEDRDLPESIAELSQLVRLKEREMLAHAALDALCEAAERGERVAIEDVRQPTISNFFSHAVFPWLERYFPVIESGVRQNPKLARLREKRVKEHRRLSEAGRAGGKASAKVRQPGALRTIVQRSLNDSSSIQEPDADADEEKKELSRTSRARRAARSSTPFSSDFEEFWSAYPTRRGKRVGKRSTYEKWQKVKRAGRAEDALRAARNYARSKAAQDGFAKDPVRFFKQDWWEDWLEGAGVVDPEDDRPMTDEERRRFIREQREQGEL